MICPMIGTKLSNHEIAQLAAGLAVIAAFLIWLIAAVITGIISFFSLDWGCYACGWRGRRRQIYRPDAFKMNFSGLPTFLITHTIGPFIILASVVMRLRSTLNCPECASTSVQPLTQDAPPLPPPRRSRAARAFLQGRGKLVKGAAPAPRKQVASAAPDAAEDATESEAETLAVRCNHCEQEVEIPFDGGIELAPDTCPACGYYPFEFEVT